MKTNTILDFFTYQLYTCKWGTDFAYNVVALTKILQMWHNVYLFHRSIYEHVNTIACPTEIHLRNLLAEVNFVIEIVVLARLSCSLEFWSLHVVTYFAYHVVALTKLLQIWHTVYLLHSWSLWCAR